MSKIEAFWGKATADDVARVMAGETVEARFWDDEHRGHTVGLLAGWTKGDPSWLWCDRAHGQTYFENCQVYREPAYWTERPDPGPGWRLLGKFPDEPKLGTDEAWDCHSKEWKQTFTDDGDQVKTVWYRRRIEAVEAVGPVEQLIAGGSYWHPNGLCFFVTEKGFEVTQ
jgi:hypothetical protein